MLQYFLRRLIQFIPTLLGIYILTFALMRVLPGDAAQFLEGDRGDDQSLAATRARLGLDEPLTTQFLLFFRDAVQGELGRSFITNRPVSDMIGQAFPHTAALAICAMLIAVTVGISLGITAAMTQNSIWDNIARLIALIGVSVPVFWLGLQLQILFGLQLRLLPVSGAGFDEHLILPSVAASFGMMAVLMRITRSTLLEVLNQDYIRTARGKGLHPRRVILRHAISNALLPIVTVWGTGLASLLSGTLLVEVIFSYPGMGRLLVDSIGARDYPSVQGLVITFALIYAGLNLFVDMLYPIVDPRIRYA
ncbi:MAG: ABC transporter permease [Anaerolineae bacterium]|jgi:ABC-type dipeptide/oligopeptide/nickel transport system permease component|nr:ABC transporter permease [Anaerolineae bacterium]